MKTVTFTEFRNKASGFIAEVIPFSDEIRRTPAWKKPGIRLQIQGSKLSSAILLEREMKLSVDSSSFAKRYIQEDGSGELDNLLQPASGLQSQYIG